MPGGFEQNRPRVVFLVAVATDRAMPSCSRSTRSPPAAAREWIRTPHELLSPCALALLSLPRSLSAPCKPRDAETLAELRRAIAGVPRRH